MFIILYISYSSSSYTVHIKQQTLNKNNLNPNLQEKKRKTKRKDPKIISGNNIITPTHTGHTLLPPPLPKIPPFFFSFFLFPCVRIE